MSEPTEVTAEPPVLVQLPTDLHRSASAAYEPGVHPLPASDWPLDTREPEARALLLGAFVAFLYRHSHQPALVLDVCLYERERGRLRRLSLRPNVGPAARVVDLVEAAERELASSLAVSSTVSKDQRTSNVAVTFGDGVAEAASHGAIAAGYDLHVVVTEGSSATPVLLAYNAFLFRPETIARVGRRLSRLLAAALADRTTSVHCLPVLEAEERRLLTEDWNSGSASYPPLPVHAVFGELARQQPNAIAAVFKDQRLSYRELDERSNRLARYLVACDVHPGSPVAVCVLPSFDILIAMMAIWKAGGVYVPLDPTHPEALIKTILDEAKPALVLTQSKLEALTQPSTFRQFCLDGDLSVLDALPGTAPELPALLELPAYLLYTSGTTGKPKGVLASHENLAHHINVAQRMYGFGSSDVFCSVARYTFSISMFELVSPLCCGGSVRLFERDEVLAPDRLADNLQDITVFHAGPSLLGSLFRYLRTVPPAVGHFARMRHASSGGDLVPPHIIEEMKQVFENAELYVIYGCTEISCMGCTYPIRRSEKVTASYVGRPFPDVSVRLLDAQRNLVPLGVVGEICFAGKGVVKGYFQRPALDAEKFVDVDGERYYTTGDMGRFDAEGQLEILGRRDFQIQLRGIRVELVGIENTVKELGLAAQCAVVVKKINEQDQRLIAFVVKPSVDGVAEFRRALAQHLPDYMVPQGMVAIDAMPLTVNGKLDRNKLQELPWESKTAETGTPPRTEVERKIAAAFAEALGLAEIGIDDDFFDLGGHSLLAVTVTRDVENRLGLSFPPGVLFERTTVRALAEHATESFTSEQKPLLLAGKGDKPALFMLLGVYIYRDLARRLQDRYSVYGVYAGRELVVFDTTGEAPPVVDLAREYIEIIRREQPKGPYRIGGMSFGGIIAYEAARQLHAAGEQVVFLGMIDTVLPEPGLRGQMAKAKRLLGLPPQRALSVVASPLRSRWSSVFARRARSEFIKYGDDEKLRQLEERRDGAYDRSALAYVGQMRVFAVNATIIVSGRRIGRYPLQSSDCGWRRLLPAIDVRVVDADHVALVEEPNVREVAEIFRAGLSRTEEAHSPSPSRTPRQESGVGATLDGSSPPSPRLP